MPLSIVDQFDEIFVSAITYMEILGFNFEDPNEEIFIKDLLSVFKTIYIDQRIVDIVIRIRKKKRIKLPDAMAKAEIGMMNIPVVMENNALLPLIIDVTKPTVTTTTKGLTFAYHEGDAPSPAILSTYLGIVA